MTPITAVLFDYGMVLSGPPDPAAWARLRSITGFDEERLHGSYWAHRHPYDRGDLTASAYWQKVARHNASDESALFSPSQLEKLIAADVDLWSQVNQPMLEWAQSLQRAGIPTGILSNIGDAMSEGLVSRFDWLGSFSHRTWSHAHNLAKPEPAIYHLAADGLHTPPENVLFIDDRIENINAAIAVGMHTIQYLDHTTFEAEMQRRGLAYLLNPADALPPA